MTDQGTVFVAYNDANVRSSIATLVKSHGGQSECYETVDSVLKAYDESSSACLVTELPMHGMNFGLRETLAAHSIEIPVVFVVAGHQVRDRQ